VTGTTIQFVVGGTLLCFLVWLKIHDFGKIVEVGTSRSPKVKAWIKTLTHVALGLIVSACLLDPLIPGFASLNIELPADLAYPTLQENLRVRVIPLGLLGQSGGDRITYAAFDSEGFAEVLSHLTLLETRVEIQVFDQTQPLETIKSANVYISPFVRRLLVRKTITFEKKENTVNRKLSYMIAFPTILCVAVLTSLARSATSEFQITAPKANAVVPGEVIEVSGVGADPNGTVEIEVLTNDWYLQDGKVRINPDGTWTFSPVHLAGKGTYNNHTVRATIVKDGHRGKAVTVSGIVRRQ